MADYNIKDFNAIPDGKTLNTAAIQKAIDECHATGGGRVVCGGGCYMTGGLMLKSNVEFHLEHGCRLLGSGDLADYTDLTAPGFINNADKTAEKSSRALIMAVGAENISVTGQGTIDGNGLCFYRQEDADPKGKLPKPSTQRPRIVMFYGCRNVRFEDISCIDSSCWTFWLMKCGDVNIHRVKIRGNSKMRNIDGIDIDACRNVLVSDCIIETEDDCIAVRSIQKMYDEPAVWLNITVTNCVFRTECNGVRIGCPSDSVIRNCVFSNLVIEGTSGIAVQNPKRYLSEGSTGCADIHDISFSNIRVRCSRYPVEIYVEEGISLKRISDFSFSNFTARSGGPIFVQGSSQTIVKKINFSNMQIETSGKDACICRNCEGIVFNAIEFSNTPAVNE